MKKYGKDYRRAVDGYEYIGSWYKTALTGDALKKEARFFWICLAVMSVQFVLGLSLNNAGSRILWILLPFVALFLPLLYGWMGSAKLYGIGKRLENARANQAASDALQVQIPKAHQSHLRRSEYEQSFRRLLRSFVAGAVLSNAVFLADILVLVSDAALGSVAGEAVFAGNAAVLAVLNLVCAVKSWKAHASVRTEKEVSAPEGQHNENVPKN